MNILIVEDNLAHLKLTQYVLKRTNVKGRILVVRDGQEALDYLFRKGSYDDLSKYPLPDIILLDLNLPKRDGKEVLKILKDDPVLREIPIVIVSTADREEDISYALQTGAAAYISKSAGFDRFNVELAGVMKYACKK